MSVKKNIFNHTTLLLSSLSKNNTQHEADTMANFIDWFKENQKMDEDLASAVITDFGSSNFIKNANKVHKEGLVKYCSQFNTFAFTKSFFNINKKYIIDWLNSSVEDSDKYEDYISLLINAPTLKIFSITEDDIVDCVINNNQKNPSFTFILHGISLLVVENVCEAWEMFRMDAGYSDDLKMMIEELQNSLN